MKTLRNIVLAIAIFIVVKMIFSMSGYIANGSTSHSRPVDIIDRSWARTEERTENPTEGFERISLSGGIQIDVPLQWERLSDELTTAIRTASAAHLSNQGIDASPDGSRLLAAYNSRPTTTYASLRIKETVPAPISASELESFSDAEIAGLAPEFVQLISGPMARQKQDLLPGAKTTRQLISGHPALVFRYRRLGEGGVVSVEIIRVITPRREVLFTLSYREAEASIWHSVIENMRRSIFVP